MIHNLVLQTNESSAYCYYSQIRPRLASENTTYTDLSTSSTPFGSLQGRTIQHDETATGENTDRIFRLK